MEIVIAVLLVGAAYLFTRKGQAAPTGSTDDATGGAAQTVPDDGSVYTAPIATPSITAEPNGGGWVGSLIDFIKQQEGFSSTAYKDEDGQAIGYGHDLTEGESFPNGISQAEADQLLQADVANAQGQVQALVKVPLTQGQSDALTDFVYNLGAGKLQSSTLLRLLNQGDYAAAGEQLLRWIYAGGQPSDALKARRQAELAMWNG